MKEEFKEIKREEHALHAELAEQRSAELTDAQKKEIAVEKKHAEAGEEELIDRWMMSPTYAPVMSLQDLQRQQKGTRESIVVPILKMPWRG